MTGRGDDLIFLCLDPRKGKHALMATVLTSIGSIRWRRLPPLSVRSFPETRTRAREALEAGTRRPKGWVATVLKRWMLELQYNGTRRLFAANPGLAAAAWNGLNGSRRVFMDAAKDAGTELLYFELSPFPNSVTVDPCGVNFRNSLPRQIDPYRKWLSASGLPGDVWRSTAPRIRQRKAAGPRGEASPDLPGMDAPFLFAPLQVPGDSQLRLFGGDCRTVEAFLDMLADCAACLPDGWHLRVKEHPSSPARFADRIGTLRGRGPIFLDNAGDTFDQVRAARGVVTVNSSVGLEAMFFDKPVIACGQCFWAIDGVAHRAPDRPALAAAFRTAEDLTFRQADRDAFLSFLTEVYYPRLDRLAEASPAATRQHEAAKITARLGRGSPGANQFWRAGRETSAR